jgi:dolichol-phosphate mannosyltransferase
MNETPVLSLVIPAFNEVENLGPLYQRVVASVDPVVDAFELLFVDDGSTDSTWEKVLELRSNDARVRGVRLARNFGHQAAVTAGIDAARGQAVVILDADLQDPPEVIPELVEKWKEGFEVVYGRREHRDGESLFKKASAAGFYRILRFVTRMDIPVDTGDFRLLGPRAIAAFRALPERNRFIRGLVSWIGFRQCSVSYRRQQRYTGETKYPLRKMVSLALDGITSFSRMPLRLATWAGFLVSTLAFLYIVVVIVLKIKGINWPGYTSIMASILFLGGVQLIVTGILGEYVGRIYDEVKNRPLYLVGEQTGEDDRHVMPQRR